jgi:NAD(P)-dependent dehydrogenase (short-subunit alcohol dehydrogenase family)
MVGVPTFDPHVAGGKPAPDGVQVLVVRLGFVRTRMTGGLDAAPLSQTQEQVADVIVAGLRARRHTVWAPPAMRWVMSVLRHLPHAVFTRLPTHPAGDSLPQAVRAVLITVVVRVGRRPASAS